MFHWQSGGKQWAVRDGDWKLIGNPRDTSNKAPITANDKLFLSNLKVDHSEMKNIADQHPEIVDRLKKSHDAWAREVSGR
jgi:arylsulfatase A-like enzyme